MAPGEKMFRMFSYLTKLIKHNSSIPGGELTTHYSMPKFGTQIVETFDSNYSEDTAVVSRRPV